MTLADLRRILALLGPAGLAEGLRASEIPREALFELVKKARIKLQSEPSRNDLIEILVTRIKKVELKPTDQLLTMSYDQLVRYFAEVSPTNDALIKIMKELNFKVGAEDKKHLRRFVARQISETALFSNVAGRKSDERDK